jgi:hypothetical protein
LLKSDNSLRIMDLIKPNFEEGGVGDVPTRGQRPLTPHSSIRSDLIHDPKLQGSNSESKASFCQNDGS